MSAWGRGSRVVAVVSATVVCAAMTLWRCAYMQSPFVQSDVSNYLMIAQGDTAHVAEPFVVRQMGPLVTALVARLLHLTLQDAFFALGVVYLLVTLGCVFWLVANTAAPRWMLAAVMLFPAWALLFQALAFPDLIYAALVAVLLLLLSRGQMMAAALMMFPMMFTRESTWLTLGCLLVACWAQMRWKHRVAAMLSAVAGALLVHRLTLHHLENKERLPQAVYILGKLPWNYARNVLGLLPWSNANVDGCMVPRWQMPLHYGVVRAIGICGIYRAAPETTAYIIFSAFGLLPLIVGFLWWRSRRATGKTALTRFVLLYGGASLVLAAGLGAGFAHLSVYAWPLFILGPALLLNEFGEMPMTGARALSGTGVLLVHVATAATFWVLGTPECQVVRPLLWALGFVLLRYWMGSAGTAPNGHEFHPLRMVKST